MIQSFVGFGGTDFKTFLQPCHVMNSQTNESYMLSESDWVETGGER